MFIRANIQIDRPVYDLQTTTKQKEANTEFAYNNFYITIIFQFLYFLLLFIIFIVFFISIVIVGVSLVFRGSCSHWFGIFFSFHFFLYYYYCCCCSSLQFITQYINLLFHLISIYTHTYICLYIQMYVNCFSI